MVVLLNLRAAEEGVPQGLKPDFVLVSNVWAKAQTYLRSKCNGNGKSNNNADSLRE